MPVENRQICSQSATDLPADEQIWRWLIIPQDEFKYRLMVNICVFNSVMKTFLVTFQLSLVEREINEVMRGCNARSRPGKKKDSEKDFIIFDGREKLKQKDIETEDVCPICQEEFLQQPEPLTFCK